MSDRISIGDVLICFSVYRMNVLVDSSIILSEALMKSSLMACAQ